jgi:protein-S-isoprenylcysteine O-methyltransferase Ste14
MHVLALKVPPLAVGLLIAAIMWLAAWATPTLRFVFPARSFFSVAFVVTGGVISGLGIASFRRAKTTVNPMKPDSSSSLVMSGVAGIYTYTRNPMYLGFLFILVGWAIFLSNVLAFFLLPGFILYMNRFQIEPEEKALASRFGEVFVSYASRVRRWL